MDILVTAEFDSVDLADLASHKVRHLDGVNRVDIIKNRFARGDGDEIESVLPVTPIGSGYSNLGISFTANLVPVAYGPDIYHNETNEKRDALLKAEVADSAAAAKVSSILTSQGGRHVKVIDEK